MHGTARLSLTDCSILRAMSRPVLSKQHLRRFVVTFRLSTSNSYRDVVDALSRGFDVYSAIRNTHPERRAATSKAACQDPFMSTDIHCS